MMIKGKSHIVKEGRIRTGGGKVYKSLGGDLSLTKKFIYTKCQNKKRKPIKNNTFV